MSYFKPQGFNVTYIFKFVCTPLANWLFDEGQTKEAPAEAEQAARREQTEVRRHCLAQQGIFRLTPRHRDKTKIRLGKFY